MATDIYQIISDNLLSLMVIVFGAMFLYFGKIIQDYQVNDGNKMEYYSNGLIFSSVLVILPLAITFAIFASLELEYNIGLVTYIFFILIAILLIDLYYVNKYHNMRKHGVSIKKTRDEQYYLYTVLLLFSSVISWIIVFYCYGCFKESQANFSFAFVYFLLASFTAIFVFTLHAMIFSLYSVYYPTVRIYIDNWPVTNGKLIKFGDTIQVIVDGRLVVVNKDKILFIEELD